MNVTKINYFFFKLIRSIFFWIPRTETEIAMERLSVILDRKENLTNKMFSEKYDSRKIATEIDELLELTNETKLAMSDEEYIEFEFEIQHRKDIVSICDTLILDLNGLREINLIF